MINKLLSNLPDSFVKESVVLNDFLTPIADELSQAQAGVMAALDQVLLTTADGEWLDEWGGYFGITRQASEADEVYGLRIIAELIQPKCNNVALSNAIGLYVGGLSATVTDAPLESTTINLYRDGGTYFDGKKDRQSITRNYYGQFDVNTQYDLTSGENLTNLSNRIKAVVERLKAAGTKLRSLVFSGYLADTATAASDVFLHQLQIAPIEDLYSGARQIRDGSIYRGAVQADLYNGTVARNGTTLRFGWHTVPVAPAFGALVDPMVVMLDATMQDAFASTVTFGSGYQRDGSINRRGVVGDLQDQAGITITKVLARDGRYHRGSSRDGSLRYNGIPRTFGTVVYGGQTTWSESLV
jgi:hypothetical protein